MATLTRAQALTALLGIGGVAGALARSRYSFDWPNTAAYRLALRELQIIVAQSLLINDDPAEWGAFSREHTMWRARAR